MATPYPCYTAQQNERDGAERFDVRRQRRLPQQRRPAAAAALHPWHTVWEQQHLLLHRTSLLLRCTMHAGLGWCGFADCNRQKPVA